SCPDVAGIQAAVTGFLFEHGAFLEEVASHGDPQSKTFFSRIVFSAAEDRAFDPGAVETAFAAIGRRFSLTWRVDNAARRGRPLTAVSRAGHCLNDLLHRWSAGTLPIEVVGVVSNHGDLRRMAEWHGVAFHHLPIMPEREAAQEAAVLALIAEA